MACDFVVATHRARWGMPEVDVGITPGWGGTTRMARLIGRRMTKEVNLLGALHPAARAVQLGLWNRVVDDDRLDDEADALAVNGAWHVPDADGGDGIAAFAEHGSLWQRRRGLARDFWADA